MVEAVNDRGLKLGRKILLKGQSHILSEMKTIYRLAARGRITTQEAGSLARILKSMREMLLSSELEERVAQLEEAMAERRQQGMQRPALPGPNGHGADEHGEGRGRDDEVRP